MFLLINAQNIEKLYIGVQKSQGKNCIFCRNEKCNIKCERKRKPPDALFFYPETEKKAIHGHFIKSVLCGVG